MSLGSAAWSFALVAGLVTLTPGLDTALVLRSTLTNGRRHAVATALGINTGVLVWALAAAVGVSALLTASEAAYTTLRIAGATYMVVLGARLLWNALHGERSITDPADEPVPTEQPVPSTWASYRTGLFTNLLNPKVGAFYLAVLPQFIPPGSSPALVGTGLALIHNVEGLVWFALLISLAASARRWLEHPAAQRRIDALTGTVLVGFGAKLALTRH
jgi:threonine/homoserine/homoserine lactone efflux protein